MTTLETKTKAWIMTQGYPLEMRVAAILRNAGLSADPYRTYQDLQTGKSREIDIVGYCDHRGISVHMVIECKHARDKPWVLFSTKHRVLTAAGYVMSVPTTPKARDALERFCDDSSIQSMTMFASPKLVGFRLIRAHTDNQDAAYHAVVGLAGACISTAKDIGRHGHSVMYPPVVVVDSPLLECHLPEEGGELQLAQISTGYLLHNAGRSSHVSLHVVHIDALAGFVEAVKRDAAALNAKVLEGTEGERGT